MMHAAEIESLETAAENGSFQFHEAPPAAEIIYYPEAPSIEKFLQTCGIPDRESRQQRRIRIAVQKFACPWASWFDPFEMLLAGPIPPKPPSSISAQGLPSPGGPQDSVDFGNAVRRFLPELVFRPIV